MSSVVVSGLTQVLQFHILLHFCLLLERKRWRETECRCGGGSGPVGEGEEKRRGSVEEKRYF